MRIVLAAHRPHGVESAFEEMRCASRLFGVHA
jgi:hypothetical protein